MFELRVRRRRIISDVANSVDVAAFEQYVAGTGGKLEAGTTYQTEVHLLPVYLSFLIIAVGFDAAIVISKLDLATSLECDGGAGENVWTAAEREHRRKRNLDIIHFELGIERSTHSIRNAGSCALGQGQHFRLQSKSGETKTNEAATAK